MQKLIQKSHNNCVYSRFVQKSFRQKIPRDLRLLLSVVKAGRCAFLSTDFSRDLLSHSFVRFLTEFCVCDIVSCFVLSKWVDGAKFRYKRKSQRHLWSALGGPAIFAILVFYFFRPWMAVCNIRIS
jgi:hypothetical protein